MLKKAFVLIAGMLLMGGNMAKAEGPFDQGILVSQQTLDLIGQLAKEKEVVADIEDQNRHLKDEGKVRQIQDQWRQSTTASELIRRYREKLSCQVMRDYFSKEISLVDCFTLDAQGRVVGTLYKTRDFLQDEDPGFVNCFNQGDGRVYVDEPVPLSSGETVEVSFPVMDGPKTVGVLVATVLSEK